MGTPGHILVLPLVGPTDPRFVVLRREIRVAGRRLHEVSRPLHAICPPHGHADMRPLFAPRPLLRLLP